MRYIKTFESFGSDEEKELIEVGEKAAKEIEKELSPEERKILTDFYKKEGKEKVLDVIKQTTEGVNEGILTTDEEIPEEGEFGMSKLEIQARSILDRIIKKGTVLSILGVLPAAMTVGAPLAVGLGAAALAGCLFKDAAWFKSSGSDSNQTGHHYRAQSKYGMK